MVIPTNSSDKADIILKAGQRVMVLKSSKGIYMQLDSGKIIAIRTSSKTAETTKLSNNNNAGGNTKEEVIDITSDGEHVCSTTNKQIKKPNSNYGTYFFNF